MQKRVRRMNTSQSLQGFTCTYAKGVRQRERMALFLAHCSRERACTHRSAVVDSSCVLLMYTNVKSEACGVLDLEEVKREVRQFGIGAAEKEA